MCQKWRCLRQWYNSDITVMSVFVCMDKLTKAAFISSPLSESRLIAPPPPPICVLSPEGCCLHQVAHPSQRHIQACHEWAPSWHPSGQQCGWMIPNLLARTVKKCIILNVYIIHARRMLPLLGPLFWWPVMWSSHHNSFENRTPVTDLNVGP